MKDGIGEFFLLPPTSRATRTVHQQMLWAPSRELIVESIAGSHETAAWPSFLSPSTSSFAFVESCERRSKGSHERADWPKSSGGGVQRQYRKLPKVLATSAIPFHVNEFTLLGEAIPPAANLFFES